MISIVHRLLLNARAWIVVDHIHLAPVQIATIRVLEQIANNHALARTVKRQQLSNHLHHNHVMAMVAKQEHLSDHNRASALIVKPTKHHDNPALRTDVELSTHHHNRALHTDVEL